MPEYVYRAVTKRGQIVRNKVESSNKSNLIKKLKSNDLLPIEVLQVSYASKKARGPKKNIMNIDDIMKTANSANILQGREESKHTAREKFNILLTTGQKVTVRDIIIFTQNFYLLKRANFNNIHALNTIINSTDNLSLHENGMRITALADDKVVYSQTYYSIGGGFIVDEEHFGQQDSAPVEVPYPYSSAADLQKHCQETGLSLSGLMMKNELALHSKEELEQHLANVWEVMRGGIERGISTEGVLPGKLRVPRRAAALRRMLVSQDKTTTDPMAVVDWINMFALAVNEENAAGGRVVTAPTNGACGIIPAVLAYYDKFIREVNANSLARYLLVASAIGSLYKMNASISGAEVGCQGEVGVACSMAAAGLAELLGASPAQVCIAAEIAMEHNLGLTCDPVAGQVQVPCIERNAIAAVKAVNAARMALRRTSEPRVCLDKVIETMYETGKDMNAKYRETSRGGLAMKIVACD